MKLSSTIIDADCNIVKFIFEEMVFHFCFSFIVPLDIIMVGEKVKWIVRI